VWTPRSLLLVAVGLACACQATDGVPPPSAAGATSNASGGASAAGSNPGSAGTTALGGSASSGGTTDAAGTAAAAGASADAGAAGAGGQAGQAGAAPTLELRITTSNIRFDSPDDGINVWSARKALLFQVLEAQAFDSAGLQEALATQLADMAAALPEYGQLGVGRNDGKTKGEYAAILYLKARLQPESSGTFWFSDTPEVPGSKTWGNTLPRICTWARFKSIATGRYYYHYNVHLDSESQPSREKSVQLLAARIAARAQPSEPVILTGDFNAEPANLAMQYLFGLQPLGAAQTPLAFHDAWLALHAAEPEATTSHKFKGGVTGGDHIDYVLFDSVVTAKSVEIVHTHEGELYPSDHYPLSAVVELGRP